MRRAALPNWHLPGSPDGDPRDPCGPASPRRSGRLGAARYRPMLIFRFVFGLLLVAGLLCFAMYIGTNQVRWRRRGILIVKWTVIAALGFFAVLILERLALML